jgi:calcineurin-like phosphoesterase family protein
MVRFFTADLHLGHGNIIEYSGRPFRDVAHMSSELVERWNSTVEPTDEVVVLGDFAMGRIAETLPTASELNGRKVLLAGNHDRCWHGHKKGVEAAVVRYLEAGFDEIWQGSVRLQIGPTRVVASHFPYRGDSHDRDRYVAHRPVDRGAWLLHGHVHQNWKVRDRMINVAVDAWDYRPVPETAIAELMNARSS